MNLNKYFDDLKELPADEQLFKLLVYIHVTCSNEDERNTVRQSEQLRQWYAANMDLIKELVCSKDGGVIRAVHAKVRQQYPSIRF